MRVASAVVNVRPSCVHTAPVAPHAGDGDSVTVTASCEDGSTRTRQWSSRSSLRRSFVTEPPLTPSSARMCLFEPFATAASKLSSSQNAVSPSCSAGTDTKLAASGAGACCPCGGPVTLAARSADNRRQSAVQIAPVCAHERFAGTTMDTVPVPDGSISKSHAEASELSTVTSRPLPISKLSRAVPFDTRTDSLNTTRPPKRVEPSCAAGNSSVPVSGSVGHGLVQSVSDGMLCVPSAATPITRNV